MGNGRSKPADVAVKCPTGLEYRKIVSSKASSETVTAAYI